MSYLSEYLNRSGGNVTEAYLFLLVDEVSPRDGVDFLTDSEAADWLEVADDFFQEGYPLVSIQESIEGDADGVPGRLCFIRGFLGRRAYVLTFGEKFRIFWTTAGNGTPVYEMQSDALAPTQKLLAERVFRALFFR